MKQLGKAFACCANLKQLKLEFNLSNADNSRVYFGRLEEFKREKKLFSGESLKLEVRLDERSRLSEGNRALLKELQQDFWVKLSYY